MLVLRKCRVLRTPKTGSKWITAALMRSAYECTDIGMDRPGRGPNGYHATLRNACRKDLPAIAFVRHPSTWYESYWNHRMRLGWKPEEDEIDHVCADDDFNAFTRNILEHSPGYCSRHLTLWTGHERKPAAIVGRFENLQRDILNALDVVHEPFDRELLLSTPGQNCGNYKRFTPVWDEGVKRELMRADAGIINRFYS